MVYVPGEGYVVCKVQKLLQAGGWSSVSQVGILLFLQIDLMVANVMLGFPNPACTRRSFSFRCCCGRFRER
ncbi:hypothetical protein PO124_11380 [Bacillus licheniformis]|nr:hypothetical protein [Bacillus licheniformis]